MKKLRIALVGTDSLRGKEIKNVLEQKHFPISVIEFYDPKVKEEYSKLTEFAGEPKVIHHLDEKYLEGLDLVFLAAAREVNARVARRTKELKCRLLDVNETFNDNPRVPLIVAGINDHLLSGDVSLVANPHPVTIFLAHVLHLLSAKNKIKKVVGFVLQPASAYDESGMDELANQSISLLSFETPTRKVFPTQVAFNLISCFEEVDNFGFSPVERRIIQEVKRVLNNPRLPLFVSLIQAPVFHTYSIMIYFECDREMEIGEIEQIFINSPYFKVAKPEPSQPVSAITVAGKDEIFIGQIKKEPEFPNHFWLWTVADNLTRGSALNAYEVALKWFGGVSGGRKG
jgi:aspartate-semialdehyde dehydrogenase